MPTTLKTRLVSLLRSTESHLKTDVVYLVKGGSWLGLGQIVASLSAFALAILFANLIPKEIYGTYKYVLAVVGMFTVFTLPGVNTPLAQSVARGKEGTFRSALHEKMRWGTLALVASLGLFLYYVAQGNLPLAFSFFIAAWFLPFMDPLALYNTYLQSKKLFRQAIVYFVLSQIMATGIIAGALYFSGNLYVILLAYFASWTGLRLYFHQLTLRDFPPNTDSDPSVISKGKHLSFISVLSSVVTNVDSFLIFHFLGPAPVALYALAIAPVNQLRASFKNVSPLALPKLTQRSLHEIQALLYHRLTILFGLGAAIALAYAIAAPYLFPILFPKYIASIPYSSVFAFTLALQLPLTFFGAVMQSKIDLYPTSWFYWSNVPQSLLILSIVFLIPLFGLWGVIASVYFQLLAALIINAVQWRMLTRRYA